MPRVTPDAPRHIAVIGAGMAGMTCARTLLQGGHRVTVFEKSPQAGGRMATLKTPWGGFDFGAQYFTVRDPRFNLALQTTPGVCKPWSATSVRMLDEHGTVVAAGQPAVEAHWVPTPGMNALVSGWAQALVESGSLLACNRVERIEPDALHPQRWQLRTTGTDEQGQTTSHVHAGFDSVMLALPAAQAAALLGASALAPQAVQSLGAVQVTPCWTLMLAFPNAMQPGLGQLGPHWNVARSTHHRIAWLARESSKPGREPIERWTVQASAAWSQEHLEDDAARVQAKLLKAFTEVTEIRAQPAFAQAHRWRYAQTVQPLGQSHLWDADSRIGLCGDWCLGHRVEDAFVSGLELALAVQ